MHSGEFYACNILQMFTGTGMQLHDSGTMSISYYQYSIHTSLYAAYLMTLSVT
jgi:hypothetical protein